MVRNSLNRSSVAYRLSELEWLRALETGRYALTKTEPSDLIERRSGDQSL